MNYFNTQQVNSYPQAFLNDVIMGLSKENRYIPPHWLYDDRGSKIFEAITDLPEYYVTRTELALFHEIAPIFCDIIGPNASLVEYGAGGAMKARIFLNAFVDPAEYVAIDISFDHLEQSLNDLALDYPELNVRPLAGDFISGILTTDLGSDTQRVGFFPGSTIGNLSNDDINTFLKRARDYLGDDAYFILGADLSKSPDVLIPAYDDAQGVTADFNLNLLTRINRELDGTIDVAKFRHRAIWNDEKSRIEMHLESQEDQSFEVAGQGFRLSKGQSIHTENSRKFRRSELEQLTSDNGWNMVRYETDENDYFAVMLLKAGV
ncbi:L-histidine N(alpha)-methyltransferase [Terasakiella sp. A23]|uniref:L-histidine N(alpha)-methyltransferase n=1 Tax=Terasakiella sp. FCG-A23 TaxID=3080561 RepID=UPI00295449D3|nr:L-histidine N(alpha)-methyltransferase [Terasakiella sp. A23]MDV7338536.1 L-histidine N(alpha)-methyltransferase [Terasakiella sp. A23]